MLNKQRGYAETLELVRRWQDPGLWSVLSQLAEQAESYQRNAERCGSDARMLLDRGDISAAVELKSESECYRNAASGVRQQRSGLISEFLQIESWVRASAPVLLEFVPVVDISNPDVPGITNALRVLESRLASEAAPVPLPVPIEGASKVDQRPKELLTSWRDIMNALKLHACKREHLRRLNELCAGPIPKPKRGGQPIVDKAALLSWWDGIDARQRELEQRRLDAQATAVEMQRAPRRSG